MIRLLFIGDIVGRPGRDLVRQGLRGLVDYYRVDLVIANAENSAALSVPSRLPASARLRWTFTKPTTRWKSRSICPASMRQRSA